MARRHTSQARSRTAAATDSEDLFLEKTLAFGTWAQNNRQTLLIGGIVVLAVLMGSLYYWNYRRGHLQQAAVELERVEQAAAFGDTSTAKVELSKYVDSYGNTPYGDEARLLLGQIYLESGQPQEAVTLLSNADVSKPIGVQVGMLLAKAQEQKGDLKAAEEMFIRVADRARLAFEKRSALEEAARVRVLQGNTAGAIELYQRILDDLSATAQERGLYEMRMQELKEKSAS